MKTMKVVRDSIGEIVGMVEITQGGNVPVSIELEKNQKLEEIEVADNYMIDQVRTIQVIRNSEGVIIATNELAEGDDIPLSVELEQGQEMEEIEAPGNYIIELDAFFRKHSKTKK